MELFRFRNLWLIFFLVGCVGGAAPPGAPVELPAVPDSVEIDVGTTLSSGRSLGIKAFASSGGELSGAVAGISSAYAGAYDKLELVWAPLQEIVIPVGTAPSFQAPVGNDIFHFDFSAFVPGCSGDTTGIICMQITREDGTTGLFHRYGQVVYEVPPTATNQGKGRFLGTLGDGIFVAASWDFLDPENKFSEVFVVQSPGDNKQECQANGPTTHALATQLGPDDSALKTVKMADRNTQNFHRGVGRWREGINRWIGFFESDDPSHNDVVDNEVNCAQIFPEIKLPPAECGNLTVAEQTHLAFATCADVQFSFPSDLDGDGVPDGSDNCPTTANPTQANQDQDSQGDACDSCANDSDDDADGDGVCGNVDNCPAESNTNQADSDGDGAGDACDTCPLDANNDADGDGVCGNVDNCPADSNADQTDSDGDGAGNACDTCPLDANNDADGDGVCGNVDNCPAESNADQTDSDGDGPGDACDACPFDANNDADGDGICGNVDNCPTAPNADQADADGDGAGDACESCDFDADNDADGDGVCGDVDNCPLVPNTDQTDADGDGVGDVCDSCPFDAANDADGDGVCGDVDNCPIRSNTDQSDADGDGVGDVCDPCPDSADNTDTDSDGICDGVDNCPTVSNTDQIDSYGFGTGLSCEVQTFGDACEPLSACGCCVNSITWAPANKRGSALNQCDQLAAATNDPTSKLNALCNITKDHAVSDPQCIFDFIDVANYQFNLSFVCVP